MIFEWRNGSILIGRGITRDAFQISICWNRRDHFSDVEIPEGELIYADQIEWYWPARQKSVWPEFYRYKMSHEDLFDPLYEGELNDLITLIPPQEIPIYRLPN